MYLDEYEKYCSHYVVGAKKISFRTSNPIVINESPFVKFEPHLSNNYDLYFNKDGVLLQSDHYNKDKIERIIYSYNQKGRLIATLRLDAKNYEFIEFGGFIYDEQGRIKLEKSQSSYINSVFEEVYDCNHSYHDNTDKMVMTNNVVPTSQCILFVKFDKDHRKIEEKFTKNNDELVYWEKKEYDESGNLLKLFTFYANGELKGTYKYFPVYNKLISGYRFEFKGLSSIREHKYVLNEKGHWTNQTLIDDGMAHTYYDRGITYY